MRTNDAIIVKNLQKKYGNLTAVKKLNFSIKKKEIFGILGPNGAGKTTTLEIIEGIRNTDSGEIIIDGKKIKTKQDAKKIQQLIGVQLQSSSYFDFLTLEEILDLFASFYKKSYKTNNLLKMVDLYSKRKQLVKHLSGGQKQKFSIIASIINDPKILFLDEPTTGLDPHSRRIIWEVIKNINKNDKTIVLTTHYMEEAEELCDRVAIMDKGQIIALDTPQNLIKKNKLHFTIKFIPINKISNEHIRTIKNFKHIKTIQQSKNKYIIKIDDVDYINDLLNLIEKLKIKFHNLEIISPNLEDVFLSLTGKHLTSKNGQND